MATFDLQAFVSAPSLECLDNCRKDNLLEIAAHFELPVPRQLVKKEIKRLILEKLVELHLLGPSVDPEVVVGLSTPVEAVERESTLHLPKTKATLPRFEPFSPQTSGSREGARVKVRVRRMELEKEERAEQRRAEYELKLAIRRMELDLEREIRFRELDLRVKAFTPMSSTQPSLPSLSIPKPEPPAPPPVVPVPEGVVDSSPSFAITKHIALMPPFRETEIDTYFSVFERIANSLKWPKELWTLLLQCKLVGKAQEVCSSLSVPDSMDYDTVKAAILRAYELVPEAYRQRFQNFRKTQTQTYVEFAREKAFLFDKWTAASKVNSQETMRELMLLEDFKNCLPERVSVYLNECKVNTLSQAAMLADEFILTHKTLFLSKPKQPIPGEQKPKPEQPGPVSSPGRNRTRSLNVDCFYCHRPGHVAADCFALKRKQERQEKSSGLDVKQPKGVGFVKTISQQSVVSADECYKPFLSRGSVSILEGKEQEIVIL
ncbi:uncharacterized protein LOC131358974 [Hemibagrus wyckioides]|uniref:uncharacterized protein LOC131358974 n=1 Tax=Hemibagrus wyckioides TaxID=337641 RepID=UPI00266C1F09|nr:uncharacterized protein LOC131358974 [Hemibagrus wyckioides]